MRDKLNIISVLLVVAAMAADTLAVRERGTPTSPVGRGVVPPSSARSGLIRSRNPIDTTTGNLIVTGNVQGGKHFRGIVPYSSFYSFSGITGSESIDSFLRYSGGGELYGQYSGRAAPFYSPSRTVTYSAPDGGVVGPQTTYMGYRQVAEQLSVSQQSRLATAQSPKFIKPGIGSELSRMYPARLRPMSMSLEEMEKLISSEGEISPADKQKIEQQQLQIQQEQMRQFEEALKQAGSKAAELERKLEYKGNILQRPTKEEETSRKFPHTPEQLNVQPPSEQETSTTSKPQPTALPQKSLDVYEQMKQKLDLLRQGLELQPLKEQAAKETEKSKAVEQTVEKEQKDSQTADKPLENLSQEQISDRARSILGQYKTFASYSQGKFNRYMLAGERYLKEGRYYLAADAYTLASVYRADDPLAYAGKSHALFAAGEYMSSALYLSRALTIFPEYAQFKVDIIAMVGDKDKLESRIADVKEWLTRSDTGELHFLLGYVYYQMDRPDEAKKSIDAAYEKLPDAPAVKTLKEAIYASQK